MQGIPIRPGAGKMPAMPGSAADDDDLEFELDVRETPPPIPSGDYLCRLSRVKVWPATDNKPAEPTFTMEVFDPGQKALLDRGEVSYQGIELTFKYPLDATDWRRGQIEGFLSAMGYPPSAWPETKGRPGSRSLGAVMKKMRAELICEPRSASPVFLVTVETKSGTGANKDRVFNNIKKIASAPKKSTLL